MRTGASVAVMRVHANEPGLIGRTLDCGINGIVVPHVNSKEEAERVVRAARFAPQGMRGMYGGRRSYGTADYIPEKANEEVLVAILIEEKRAVEHLYAILSVAHIDVFFVAPSDLAQTMGYVGQPYHPEVQKVVSETLARIVGAGRTAGALAADATLEAYLDIGVRFFLTGFDGWISEGARRYKENMARLTGKKA